MMTLALGNVIAPEHEGRESRDLQRVSDRCSGGSVDGETDQVKPDSEKDPERGRSLVFRQHWYMASFRRLTS